MSSATKEGNRLFDKQDQKVGEGQIPSKENDPPSSVTPKLDQKSTPQPPKTEIPKPKTPSEETPIPVPEKKHPIKSVMPIFQREEIAEELSRLDIVYNVLDFPVLIDQQDSLSGQTFDQLQSLTRTTLPITRDNFITMWKMLTLKRVQDVLEKEKKRRHGEILRIDRSTLLPAPLSDLLSSLGSFTSPGSGFTCHMVLPEIPDAAAWRVVNADFYRQWNTTVERLKTSYLMREFPSPSDYENRPLTLLCIEDTEDGETRSVRAYNNDPTPSDAFVRCVNDNLFQPAHEIIYDRCAFPIINDYNLIEMRRDYTSSYVLKR